MRFVELLQGGLNMCFLIWCIGMFLTYSNFKMIYRLPLLVLTFLSGERTLRKRHKYWSVYLCIFSVFMSVYFQIRHIKVHTRQLSNKGLLTVRIRCVNIVDTRSRVRVSCFHFTVNANRAVSAVGHDEINTAGPF